jgi:CRP/FNR family cyclic AMP-dependent transcriptional regulator
MIETTLKNVPLFAGLAASDLQTLSSHAVTRSYPKHAVLINEGDRTDSLYVIQTGKVKVFLNDQHGKEVILSIQGPGECFGEIALLDEAPRSASVMTLENSTMTVISKTDLSECLARNPDIALNMIRHLSQRVRALTESVKSLALMDVYGRVAHTLLQLAKEEDGKLVISQKLTQQDIANMVGASREMVSRIFKDLLAGGYISVDDKRITINEKLPPGW